MKEVSRSKYRVVKTRANRIWLFPEIPNYKHVLIEEIAENNV